MTIVNPYLKKKTPAGGPPSIRIPSSATGAKPSDAPPQVTPHKQGRSSLPATMGNTVRSAHLQQHQPQQQKKERSAANVSQVTPAKASAGHPRATPSTDRLMLSNKSNLTPPPSGVPRSNAPSCGGNTRLGPPNSSSSSLSASLSAPSMLSSAASLSLKQRLKQEINALKKQKQLQKLQREAEERRRKILEQGREKEKERRALMLAQEEERKQRQAERERLLASKLEQQRRKQAERERRQKEKQLEQERRQEERRLREEARLRREEERWQQEQKRAEDKYQRDLLVWRFQHQRWLQQQQQQQTGYGWQQPGHLHQPQLQQLIPMPITSNTDIPVAQPSAVQVGIPAIRASSDSGMPYPFQGVSSSDFSPVVVNSSEPIKMEASIAEPATTDEYSRGRCTTDHDSYPSHGLDSSISSDVSTASPEDVAISNTGHASSCAKLAMEPKLPYSPIGAQSIGIAPTPAQVESDASIHSNQPISNKENTTGDGVMVHPHVVPSMGFTSPKPPQRMEQLNPSYNALIPSYSGSATLPMNAMIVGCPSSHNIGGMMIPNMAPHPLQWGLSSPFFPRTGFYSWICPPPPPPPPPPATYWKHQLQSRLRRARTVSSSKANASTSPVQSKLCSPLVPPSPFAQQGRVLVAVVLVRNAETEPSFGVNLQYHKVSALVDPGWVEEQEREHRATHELALRDGSKLPTATKQTALLTTSTVTSTSCNMLDIPSEGVDGSIVEQNEYRAPISTDTPKLPSLTKMESIPTPSDNLVTQCEGSHTTNESMLSNTTFAVNPNTIQSIVANEELTSAVLTSECGVQTTRDSNDINRTAAKECSSVMASLSIASNKDQNHAATKGDGKPDGSNSAEQAQISEMLCSKKEPHQELLSSTTTVAKPEEPFKQPLRRKRRRRMNFGVMLVLDAEKQNTRRQSVSQDEKLQPGDIIIAIAGQNIAGMTFKDACSIFSSKSENVADAQVETKVVVARKKEASLPAPVLPVPTTSNLVDFKATSGTYANCNKPATTSVDLPLENTSTSFTAVEIAMLAECVRKTLIHRSRMLGTVIPDSIWQQTCSIFRMAATLCNSSISYRSIGTLQNKWIELTRTMEYGIAEKARKFWTSRLQQDCDGDDPPFFSDAERSAMRNLPRPAEGKGCRCKQKDHHYLFDPKCTLYRDLRKRLPSEEIDELVKPKKVPGKCSSNDGGLKDLNAVESAFKSRILKLKENADNESLEARFVAKMEEIQVKELKKAIFAPNLTSIVLSAVFELQRDFLAKSQEDAESMGNFFGEDGEDVDEGDEDYDDVLLIELGKRKPKEDLKGRKDGKKQRVQDNVRQSSVVVHYLIRMLEYISKTWGHCYREPSNEDYAWRWEVFHGHNSENEHWESQSTSPRVPYALTFENIRFGFLASNSAKEDISTLQEKIMLYQDSLISAAKLAESLLGKIDQPVTLSDKLEPADDPKLDISSESLEQLCLALHSISPSGSGLYDELLSLVQSNVLEVRSGIPVLTQDWWTKVDIIILDDMDVSWSTAADPEGRYCINDELRDTLEEKWVKSEFGWAMVDDRKELIFEFAVLDEWREAFEGRLEQKANHVEGIGRFGL